MDLFNDERVTLEALMHHISMNVRTEEQALISLIYNCDHQRDLEALFTFALKPLSRSYHNLKIAKHEDRKVYLNYLVDQMIACHSARLRQFFASLKHSNYSQMTKFEISQKQKLEGLKFETSNFIFSFLDQSLDRPESLLNLQTEGFNTIDECCNSIEKINKIQGRVALSARLFLKRMSELDDYVTKFGFEVSVPKLIKQFSRLETFKMEEFANKGALMNLITLCEKMKGCEFCKAMTPIEIEKASQTAELERVYLFDRILNPQRYNDDLPRIATSNEIIRTSDSEQVSQVQDQVTIEYDQATNPSNKDQVLKEETLARIRSMTDSKGKPLTQQVRKKLCKAGLHIPLLPIETKAQASKMWTDVPQLLDAALKYHTVGIYYEQSTYFLNLREKFIIFLKIRHSLVD